MDRLVSCRATDLAHSHSGCIGGGPRCQWPTPAIDGSSRYVIPRCINIMLTPL